MKFSLYKETISSITVTATEQIVSLNRRLADLTHSKHYSDSLQLFNQIHSSQCLRPDQYTLATAITASANLRDAIFGNQLHAHAIHTGLKTYPHVANTLLLLYSKTVDLESVKLVFGEIKNPDSYSWTTLLSACTKLGHIEYARDLFYKIPNCNVAIWNAMITGCSNNGHNDVAMHYFSEMHRIGIRHDNYTFASVLSLCSVKVLDFGRQVHLLVIKTGFLGRTSVINAVLTMYFNCGISLDAYKAFEEAKTALYDQITFNVMIDGLASIGRGEEALIMFKEMHDACLRPTELTFISVMSSCSSAGVAHQLHAEAIKLGFEAHTSVSNAAITMYSSCGDLNAAHMVFQRLEEKDNISWNSVISSYTQGKDSKLAMLAYLEMQRAGIKPDEFTFGSLLAKSEFFHIVEMVQALVYKNGLIFKIQVPNALVSAYSKHGKMNLAYRIFQDINCKNLVSWNTVISGFQLNGFLMDGLEQFSKLLMSEIRPNAYTFTIVLSICATISALRQGKQVHGYVITSGFCLQTCLGNALITMYAKCGVLDWSLRVFDAMIERDTVSYNALISAYAQHGQGEEAVRCFEVMRGLSGVKPDQATFTAILSACSHAGLVDDGTRVFNSMVNDYGLLPGVDHFSCIVDLLGRGGYLEEAEIITDSKHLKAHPNIWWSLFSACAAYGNLNLGRIVSGILLETERDNPSIYVLLANIYAAAGQWQEAAKIREMIGGTGMMKQPGCSWIAS
ncbi:Tetratricopeptide-like helical domain containing protein [Parasponia andersonii]|uniref:Tetratricopeptide-like helical domain containing protein n=1 Tax=Parasponia andersonii TaxID=3476 RepID=A0A2P5BJI8_PARAD|nr:Tetratricopeptide-like helical domain containing protein [Parasponia andersonii]